MRTFVNDRTGSTAVEFALVSPVFLLLIIATLVYGIALWSNNVISEVATETARCVAVDGDACTAPAVGCVEEAAVCFALGLARDRGLQDLSAQHVTIEPSAAVGPAVFARVIIHYPFHLGGYTVMLSTEQIFPNS